MWQCYIGLYIFGMKEKLLEATLIILVGGESRRMGFPKPLLLINRKNLVEIIIERLKILFSEIIVVGKGKQRIYGKEFIFVNPLLDVTFTSSPSSMPSLFMSSGCISI